MGKFDEAISGLKAENPELAEQLETAYLHDLEAGDAKVQSLESTISQQRDKIAAYAEENYDLMRAQPPADDEQKPEPIPVKQITLDDVEAYWRNK